MHRDHLSNNTLCVFSHEVQKRLPVLRPGEYISSVIQQQFEDIEMASFRRRMEWREAILCCGFQVEITIKKQPDSFNVPAGRGDMTSCLTKDGSSLCICVAIQKKGDETGMHAG